MHNFQSWGVKVALFNLDDAREHLTLHVDVEEELNVEASWVLLQAFIASSLSLSCNSANTPDSRVECHQCSVSLLLLQSSDSPLPPPGPAPATRNMGPTTVEHLLLTGGEKKHVAFKERPTVLSYYRKHFEGSYK